MLGFAFTSHQSHRSRALPGAGCVFAQMAGKHRVEELFFIRGHADSDRPQAECFDAVEQYLGGSWPQ